GSFSHLCCWTNYPSQKCAVPLNQISLWVPNEDGWENLSEENIHQPRGIGEWPDLPHKSMKPLVHGLQEDGGDYLRYLIYWKSQF
ncbi:hypothetical protein AB7W63_19220, partial [Providencia rettgeri]